MPGRTPMDWTKRPWLRQARLISGLVLFAYVLAHLLNTACGLISLAAMEHGLDWMKRIWGHPAGQAVLYGALLVHFLLALQALYILRSLRLTPAEGARMLLGFLLPFLLLQHVVGTRIAASFFDSRTTYATVLLALWHLAPATAAKQILGLLVAWMHACL